MSYYEKYVKINYNDSSLKEKRDYYKNIISERSYKIPHRGFVSLDISEVDVVKLLYVEITFKRLIKVEEVVLPPDLSTVIHLSKFNEFSWNNSENVDFGFYKYCLPEELDITKRILKELMKEELDEKFKAFNLHKKRLEKLFKEGVK